ncbi:ISKra4 family transposase, partial [Dictyobacter arantiisoli]|uniref:ISKra4 family transposase n=1 Tax=Dictyobacter arantiisoli TaxID=2014874 RepID=UPI0011EFCBB1
MRSNSIAVTEPVHPVGWGFFPLDEELALVPGSLTPIQEEHLARLATWMPFARAAEFLGDLTGVHVSAATARRQTEKVGAVYIEVQTQQEQAPFPGADREKEQGEKLVLSSDGAFVSLRHQQWAEVRTLVIGEVEQRGTQARTHHHSYFSRMMDASTFIERAEVETRRRQVLEATAVGFVTDGALWLQELIDLHRPDAVRILDFPHAAQRVAAMGDALTHAGHRLPPQALSRSLHLLKHRGPGFLLNRLTHFQASPQALDALEEPLSYLRKRENMMDYPRYQREGWPIGSGMVESANKTVMQARLKGAGMHWEARHVNPMLALRTAVCSDRWSEAWDQQNSHRLHQRKQSRCEKASHRQEAAAKQMIQAWWFWLRGTKKPVPSTPPVPQPPSPVAPLPEPY